MQVVVWERRSKVSMTRRIQGPPTVRHTQSRIHTHARSHARTHPSSQVLRPTQTRALALLESRHARMHAHEKRGKNSFISDRKSLCLRGFSATAVWEVTVTGEFPRGNGAEIRTRLRKVSLLHTNLMCKRNLSEQQISVSINKLFVVAFYTFGKRCASREFCA